MFSTIKTALEHGTLNREFALDFYASTRRQGGENDVARDLRDGSTRKMRRYVEEGEEEEEEEEEREVGFPAKKVWPEDRKLYNKVQRNSGRVYLERTKVPCQVSKVDSTAQASQPHRV